MYYAQTLASLAKHYKISMSDPWRKIPKKVQDIILFGSDEDEIKFSYDDGYEAYTCLLYTSPSPRDKRQSRMPSSA